jgi:hypothetical protein
MKKESVFLNRFGISLLAITCFVMANSSCSQGSSSYGGSTPPDPNVAYTGTFMKSDDRDTTSATGSVDATFNTSTRDISYNIKWDSLTTLPVGMHFHDDGPVIIQITGFPVSLTGSISGKANFTTNQANDLVAGKIYVMIHTDKYPSGEIMATLTKK